MSEPSEDNPSEERFERLVAAGRQEAARLAAAGPSQQPPAGAVPGFEIIGEIGRGGMGVVYRARQLSTKRVVALKIMLGGWFASASARKRFQREVELTARLQHAGIVRVLESGLTTTGQQYYAMDYVEGDRLDIWLSASERDTRSILQLFMDVCGAVDHAHQHGVIHRDLKPANVLIDADGKPHVLDFGLAKATDQAAGENALTGTMSLSGHVVGTLRYLSPEQAAGQSGEIDERTDVYALGVMLYEALTGTLPFDVAGSSSAVMQRIREEPPRPPAHLSPRVGRELQKILLQALEKEKGRRYQSAAKLADDIGRYLRGEPLRARGSSRFYILRKRFRRHRLWITFALLLVATGIAAVWGSMWWENRSSERRRARELAEARLDVLHAQAGIENGHFEEAEGRLGALLARYPGLPEARLSKAQVGFRRARQAQRQDLVLNAIIQLQEQIERDGSQWAFHTLLGEMYRAVGDHEQADRLASQAGAEAPDTAEARYLWSFTTLDPHKAAAYVKEAVKLAPGCSLFWERLAWLSVLVHDFDEAFLAAQELIDLGHPPRGAWLSFQGRVLTRKGQYDHAVHRYTEALALVPGKAACYRDRGTAYLCLQNYDEAREDYSKAVALTAPVGTWEHHKRALPSWILGSLDEAAEDYRGVRDWLGHSSFADVRLFLVLHDQARLLDQEGRAREAEDARRSAREVHEAVRDDAETDAWLKEIFDCLAGNLTPRRLVAAAESENPPNEERLCEAYYHAGEACRLNRRLDEARVWFEKCVGTELVLEPDSSTLDPMYEYHLARWRLRELSAGEAPSSRP